MGAGWHSVSVPATPHSRVVSFKDGREVVAQDVVERSLLLKSILSATSSKEKATVDLPRATFQFWVQSAVRPPTTQKLTDSSLISLIQVWSCYGFGQLRMFLHGGCELC